MSKISEINEILIGHTCVLRFSIEIDFDSLKYNLLLTLGESEDLNAKKIGVRFFDICQLKLDEFGGGLTQFMHLSIEKIDGGLDRIQFHLSELEEEIVSFSFARFEVQQD